MSKFIEEANQKCIRESIDRRLSYTRRGSCAVYAPAVKLAIPNKHYYIIE